MTVATEKRSAVCFSDVVSNYFELVKCYDGAVICNNARDSCHVFPRRGADLSLFHAILKRLQKRKTESLTQTLVVTALTQLAFTKPRRTLGLGEIS